MEILKPGSTAAYVVICPNCGCIFSFLETEAVMGWSPRELHVNCPECRAVIGQDHFEEMVR